MDAQLETTTRFGNLTIPAGVAAEHKEVMRGILEEQQAIMHSVNPYVKDYRQIMEIPDDRLTGATLVLNAKTRPVGEHERRYNAPGEPE